VSPQKVDWSKEDNCMMRPPDKLNESRYTLYMEAPEPVTNQWILHVIHTGKRVNDEKFYKASYLNEVQTILSDPLFVNEQNAEATVTIAFSRYKDYPFQTSTFRKSEQIGLYINWIASLTNELHDQGCSRDDVWATIETMDNSERAEAFSTYQKALPRTTPKEVNPQLQSGC